MAGRLTGDELVALAERVYAGESVGAALWEIAGERLLDADADADADGEAEPEITITARVKPRIAQFLKATKADHEALARFLVEALAEARRRGIDEMRAQQAEKQPGDGRGVVVMPRNRMGDLR